jgi:hypothetical protein
VHPFSHESVFPVKKAIRTKIIPCWCEKINSHIIVSNVWPLPICPAISLPECKFTNTFKSDTSKCDCEKLAGFDKQDGDRSPIPFSKNHSHFHPDEFFFSGKTITIGYYTLLLKSAFTDFNITGEIKQPWIFIAKARQKERGIKGFQINYNLYPESANIASGLSEGYYENNDFKKTITLLEKSLKLNKDSKTIKETLELLYKAKKKERRY